jgi:hypothetical protein
LSTFRIINWTIANWKLHNFLNWNFTINLFKYKTKSLISYVWQKSLKRFANCKFDAYYSSISSKQLLKLLLEMQYFFLNLILLTIGLVNANECNITEIIADEYVFDCKLLVYSILKQFCFSKN